jgi:hypothetical protein
VKNQETSGINLSRTRNYSHSIAKIKYMSKFLNQQQSLHGDSTEDSKTDNGYVIGLYVLGVA